MGEKIGRDVVLEVIRTTSLQKNKIGNGVATAPAKTTLLPKIQKHLPNQPLPAPPYRFLGQSPKRRQGKVGVLGGGKTATASSWLSAP